MEKTLFWRSDKELWKWFALKVRGQSFMFHCDEILILKSFLFRFNESSISCSQWGFRDCRCFICVLWNAKLTGETGHTHTHTGCSPKCFTSCYPESEWDGEGDVFAFRDVLVCPGDLLWASDEEKDWKGIKPHSSILPQSLSLYLSLAQHLMIFISTPSPSFFQLSLNSKHVHTQNIPEKKMS